METIKEHIQYWIDYKGTGDKYRSEHDLDCVLAGGDLLADALISLWLPLKYALDHCGAKEWVEYRDSGSGKSPKDDDDFLYLLKENLETFIPDVEQKV